MTPPRCKCGMYSLGDSDMTWTTPDGVLHSFGSCRVPAPDPAAGLEVIDYYAWNRDDRRYHNTRKRDVIHELAIAEDALRTIDGWTADEPFTVVANVIRLLNTDVTP